MFSSAAQSVELDTLQPVAIAQVKLRQLRQAEPWKSWTEFQVWDPEARAYQPGAPAILLNCLAHEFGRKPQLQVPGRPLPHPPCHAFAHAPTCLVPPWLVVVLLRCCFQWRKAWT